MISAPLHILFLGTSSFAVPSLRTLALDDRFAIDLVITQPDKPVGRKRDITKSPVKIAAEELKLKLFQPEDIRTQRAAVTSMLAGEPDFLVCIAYGQILNQDILAIAKRAPVNVHASLLPRWRGASPIHHAILAGDRETGVSVQRMVEKLDAGPVLAQASMPIDPRATFPSLHDALSQLGAQLLPRTLSTYNGTEHPQDESKVTVCRKLTRADGAADPQTMTAEQIDRKVRALVPWPGVTWGDLKILAAELEPHADGWAVPCAQGSTLYVTSIQPAGKKPMTGSAYAHGLKA